MSSLKTIAAAAVLISMSAADPAPAASIGKSQPERAGLSAKKLGNLSDFFNAEIAAGKIPGAVMLVQRRGKQAYFETFGVRDAATKIPMSPDTLFRIYSMTKPIVSIIAMMLVEEGKIVLDEPVSKYIPAFAATKVGVEKTGADGKLELELVAPRKPMTIQDLMRHTSGLTYSFSGTGLVHKLYAAERFAGSNLSNAEFAERIATLPLANQPGTIWEYSQATDVLGRVIEVVTGKPLLQVMKERVLDPLGMSHTSFYVTDKALQPLLAEPLPADGGSGPGAMFDPRIERKFQSGGGGLVSTISDYARFCQMILNGGALDDRRYISPKTFAWMTASHTGPSTGIVPGAIYLPGAGFDFGLGFAVRMQAGASPLPGSVGELNWGGAGGTSFWVDPKEEMFAILMVQTFAQRVRYRGVIKNIVYGAFEK